MSTPREPPEPCRNDEAQESHWRNLPPHKMGEFNDKVAFIDEVAKRIFVARGRFDGDDAYGAAEHLWTARERWLARQKP
jgi:hypothetical protein